ncbi:MAG TPA: Nif3-like dinuclear metal center hexameric protein [Desulfurivibrionaceae bacterium]|nr:Nif3-like dinuclear metal center hexameric protein [Desulfurivibrionaceae bacterium]
MGLTLTASNLLAELDHVAPFALAESWDNVGLMVGDPRQPVTGILVGLDPTEALLDEAMAAGANTIVTHHPLLFKPPKSIRTDQPLGRTIAKALANNLTLIACHTNLDVVGRGVSAILAEKLGLTDCQPLDGADTIGFGRIGTLAPPLPGDRFLQKASAAMQCQSLLVAGTVPSSVSRVAVCGGSGSELAEKALELGAEIYVTAEIKHSTARWAEMAGICLIDAGHFATENIVTHEFAFRINEALATAGHTIPVHVSNRQQPPFAVYCATGGTMTPETL